MVFCKQSATPSIKVQQKIGCLCAWISIGSLPEHLTQPLVLTRRHDPDAFDRALELLGATPSQRQQFAEDFRRMIGAREPA